MSPDTKHKGHLTICKNDNFVTSKLGLWQHCGASRVLWCTVNDCMTGSTAPEERFDHSSESDRSQHSSSKSAFVTYLGLTPSLSLKECRSFPVFVQIIRSIGAMCPVSIILIYGVGLVRHPLFVCIVREMPCPWFPAAANRSTAYHGTVDRPTCATQECRQLYVLQSLVTILYWY